MRCSCEQPVSRYGRVCETCGGYLNVEVRRIEGDELRQIDEDRKADGPLWPAGRVIDPERHSERGDTGQVHQPIPPADSEAPSPDIRKDTADVSLAGQVDRDS